MNVRQWITVPSEKPIRRQGFTLIEVLIVMFIFLILAAVALPTVRGLIADQKVSKATSNLAAVIDVARSRAIAEGRTTGVLFARAGGLSDVVGRAASIRVRQITGVPPYAGESSNSAAVLQPDGITARFDPSDNQLLTLSASLVADPMVSGDVDDPNAPIKNGDFIELPGGRLARFVITYRALNATMPPYVEITFDLSDATPGGTRRFPSAYTGASTSIPIGGRRVRYKIHRRPTVSSTASFSFPRGVAVDFNYSGIGPDGNEFAPHYDSGSMTWTDANDIEIWFGGDGKVAAVSDTFGNLIAPDGLIFFCIGSTDGVRPDSLFSVEKRATANLLNLDSTWLVIHPSTGRVTAAPFASVNTLPPVATIVTDPDDASLAPAVAEARALALLSDTVGPE